MTGSRRGLVPLAAVVLGGALVLVLLAFSGLPAARSSRDEGPEGMSLLISVLEGLGLQPASFQLPLLALRHEPAGSVLLVPAVGNPFIAPVLTVSDASAITDFARRGSTVVIASGYDDPVASSFGSGWNERVLPVQHDDPDRLAWPVAPHPLTDAESIVQRSRAAFDVEGAAGFPLYAFAGKTVALEYPQGEGSVVLLADPFVLSNAGLALGGNVEFITDLVRTRLREGARVLVDDLHAGGGDSRGVIAYARRRGFGPALLLGLLAVVLAAWRFAARRGPVLPPPSELAAPPAVEHVRALGSLYARGHHGPHAAAVWSRRLRRLIEGRSGVAWEPKAVEGWLEREHGAPAAAEFRVLRAGYARVLDDERLGPAELLELVQRTHDFIERSLSPPARVLTTEDKARAPGRRIPR